MTGQSSLGLQQYYSSKPYHGSRTLSKTQKENHLQKSFSSLESAIEKDLIEEPSASSELFHGFLAIGTLGTNPFTADSSTPTFSISVENLTEKETEVTSSALRLINEVKVLGADNNDGSNGSSGRNSLASCGRSSQGSTIGHSGKPEEGSGSSVHGPIICPLQGYLFGTAMGMPETTVSKKEKRISLGELFEKTKIAENSGIKDKRAEKESDTSAVQLMKKILKKKMIHASSRSSTSTRGTTDSAKVYKKRPKVCFLMPKLNRKQ